MTMTSALKFYKTSFFYAIFSNLYIKYFFFTKKINFGTLGNFVTVGDTFISKLIFKVHTYIYVILNLNLLNIIGKDEIIQKYGK
jgi:hypothetical protein